MHPILIDLGTFELPIVGEIHLALPTYGVLFALAALVAWWWFQRRAASLGVGEEHRFNLGFRALLAGIIGAKVSLVIVDWRDYVAEPARLLGTLRSAGVVMGGVAAGALAFVHYCRRHGLPLLQLGDAVVAPLALGQAVGRLGCFSAGCCYGVESASRWCSVVFHDPAARAQTGVPLGVPLVPTQLLHMVSDLALAAVLAGLGRRRLGPPGTLIWAYLILYGAGRGMIEIWRGDAQRGLFFGDRLSTSQLLSVLAIAIGVILLLRGRRHAAEA